MKTPLKGLTAVACIALLLGCAQPAPTTTASADWVTLTTAEEFDTKVVGRPLVYASGLTLVTNADGSFGGDSGVSGAWTWQNDALCRELVINGRPFPYECQTIQVTADGARFRALNPDGSPRPEAAIR